MEHDLEELFTFAQNQMMGFKVVDNEESKSFYLNDEFIGGWAGDTREFFFENNDEFQFLKESYEARRRMEQSKKQREYAKKTKYMDLFIKNDNVQIGAETAFQLGDIYSNKYLGYFDGPEDLVHDISYNNNIQDLHQLINKINEIKDEIMDFPDNAVFRIEKEEFAVLNDDNEYEMSKNFPQSLVDKYKGNKVFQISIIQNEEGKYITKQKVFNHENNFITQENNHTEPKLFDTEQLAKVHAIQKIKEDYAPNYDNRIRLFINNNEIPLSNELKRKNKMGM